MSEPGRKSRDRAMLNVSLKVSLGIPDYCRLLDIRSLDHSWPPQADGRASAQQLSNCQVLRISVRGRIKKRYKLATALLQPHPAGMESSSFVIPEASQICMMILRTALTSSTVAPLFSAPLRCPFNWGFACAFFQYESMFQHTYTLHPLTSCGIRPARRTKLLSVAVSTVVLLKIYEYMSRAAMPRSSVPH